MVEIVGPWKDAAVGSGGGGVVLAVGEIHVVLVAASVMEDGGWWG